MAGFAIGNQLMNIAGMGASYGLSQIGSGKREREDVASDLQNRLDKSIDKISKQLTKLNSNLDPATITKESLPDTAEIKTDALKNAETAKATADAELNKVNSEEPPEDKFKNSDGTVNTTKYQAAMTAWHNKISAAEEKVKKAEAKVETEKTNKDKLVDELKTLIDNRIKIQKEINDAILDFADGDRKGQRNEYNKSTYFDENNSTKEVKSTSKKDIAQLIYLFRNTDDVEQKREYAQAIGAIDNAAFLNEASNDQVKARKIMQDWLTHNPPKTQQGQS
jgi:chromosome segregation ATPase